jgi:glucoamylase
LGPSRIWFTLGHGIVNEVYYPRVDLPQVRDLGFIIAGDDGFWCEVKRQGDYRLNLPAPGVPAPTIVHHHDRFELTVRVVPDSSRDVLLVDIKLTGDEGLRPYVLLAPHLGGSGWDNIAAAGRHYGRNVLWAEQGPFGLALAAVSLSQRDALHRMSAGFVGVSDGWQDFSRNQGMTWRHERAGPGNVALIGELERECVLGLAFGASRGGAASLAVASLARPFEQPWEEQITAWRDWHENCHESLDIGAPGADLEAQFHTSRMVLRCHMDKLQSGAMVASLSVPWGNTSDGRGGYHLVWPRDLVECATALLAVGGEAEARDVLRYLIATQYEDGHWNQNQWLGGTPFWQGIQLDETAFPVILAALLHERDALAGIEVADMIRRALDFVSSRGPVTDQDRWEEDRGINAFTLAACIAALVSGAEFLDGDASAMALRLADDWNKKIESWLYAEGTDLAKRAGVAGHYIRVAPPEVLQDASARKKVLQIKNRDDDLQLSAELQVSTDFLQLVRFGLRSPDDPRVRNSLAVIDSMLRVDTPSGPSWYRYNGDGYGEHPDGRAFDGTGQGRAWPILTGERGHYALLAGEDPWPYLRAMCAMSGNNGMLPEQVWDSAAIPEKGLKSGKPTGSAMPLAWSHAEFVKLLLSIKHGRPVDCPRAVFDRYYPIGSSSNA